MDGPMPFSEEQMKLMSNPFWNPRANWERAVVKVEQQPVAYAGWSNDPRIRMEEGYGPYPIQPSMFAHGMKPIGYPIVKTNKTPPKNPPNNLTVGRWVTVDAGWGSAPAYGFLARETGLEDSESPHGMMNAQGHYVSVHTSGVETEAWVWIPEINSSFGR